MASKTTKPLYELQVRTSLRLPGPACLATSIGHRTATCLAAFLTPTRACTLQARSCREENSCSGSLDRMLRQTLHAHLPSDAWMKCRNKGYLSISAGTPLGPSQPLLVSDFKSQEDLISAAAVSSFIPLWSGSRFTMNFRVSNSSIELFNGLISTIAWLAFCPYRRTPCCITHSSHNHSTSCIENTHCLHLHHNVWLAASLPCRAWRHLMVATACSSHAHQMYSTAFASAAKTLPGHKAVA